MHTKRFDTLFKKCVQFRVGKNLKKICHFLILLKELDFHQKSVNKALDMVLILFTKFVPNFTFRRCSYGTNILIM